MIYRRRTLITTMVLLLISLVLLLSVFPSASVSQSTQLSQSGFSISSLTPSLIPVDAKVNERAGLVEVTLRNASSKNITAFQVWGASRTTIEYINVTVRTPAEAHLAPDAGYFLAQPLDFPPPKTIEVRTVIFEDGTIEGDQTVATQILQFRRGTKLQMEEISPLLDSIRDGIGFDDSLISARSELARLVSTKKPAGPLYVSGGRKHALQFALAQVDRIQEITARARAGENQRLSPAAALSDFKKRFTDMLERLPE